MIAMYRFLKYMNNLNKPIIFQNYEYQLMNDIWNTCIWKVISSLAKLSMIMEYVDRQRQIAWFHRQRFLWICGFAKTLRWESDLLYSPRVCFFFFTRARREPKIQISGAKKHVSSWSNFEPFCISHFYSKLLSGNFQSYSWHACLLQYHSLYTWSIIY